MKRISIVSMATLTATLALGSTASAQVTIRAPFVRVQVGGPGVYVRAPFVNLFVPSGPPPVFVVPETIVAPPVFVPPPPMRLDQPLPPPVPSKPLPPKPMPPPEVNPDRVPPVPVLPERVLTLDQFAKSFQPKAGSYEVMLLNPVTRQATAVRFTLPEGTPRRVHVARDEIEFNYGPRRYVRIQFDRDGVEVSTR